MGDTGVLRVALLGYGLGGASFHAPLIATDPRLTLAAIVTADPSRQAAARARHRGAAVLDTADEVFTHADRFDLVVVSTPNVTHVPLARAAIRAGLAVVVDKPLAASAADARAVQAEAVDAGTPVIPFHNRRWDGDFLTLRSLLDVGRLGRVHRFESRFERWRPDPTTGSGVGWKEDPDPTHAGGILFDLGPHLIDQALLLFGPPESVRAEIATRRPGAVVDDDVFVALTFAAGVQAHLWMSALAADLGPRLRVLGSDAAYVKHGLDVQEAALRAGDEPGPAWGEEPEPAWGTVGTPGTTTPVPTLAGAYPRFYAGVAATLLDGAPPPVELADAIAVLDVIEAARADATTTTAATTTDTAAATTTTTDTATTTTTDTATTTTTT